MKGVLPVAEVEDLGTVISRSIPTLTIPPGSPGVNKKFRALRAYQMPGGQD